MSKLNYNLIYRNNIAEEVGERIISAWLIVGLLASLAPLI